MPLLQERSNVKKISFAAWTVKLLAEKGITETAAIAELTGHTQQRIRQAKAELRESKPACARANRLAPKSKPACAEKQAGLRGRARVESNNNNITNPIAKPFTLPRPPSAVAPTAQKGLTRGGRDEVSAALISGSPDEGVTLTPDGALSLAPAERADWLAKFAGDAAALELALTQAAGFIQPCSSRPLLWQVRSQLARIAGMRRDSDRRYQAARRATPGSNEQPEWWARMMAEARGEVAP